MEYQKMNEKQRFYCSQLCLKLYTELLQYQMNMYGQPVGNVYGKAYEIDSMVSIYEEMVEKVADLSLNEMMKLCEIPNLLEVLYQAWLNEPDNRSEEMQSMIQRQIPVICQLKGGEYV